MADAARFGGQLAEWRPEGDGWRRTKGNQHCSFRCSYVKKLMVMAVFLRAGGARAGAARCGGRGGA